MPDPDIQYFRGREMQERRRAQGSAIPSVSAIHAAFADQYAQRIRMIEAEAGTIARRVATPD